MNLTSNHVGRVAVVHLFEPRLTYPLLPEFTATVTTLLVGGSQQILVDLSAVSYIDSAAIGCLMDFYRKTTATGGHLALSGVQKRVETMLTMTGAHNFLVLYQTEADGVRVMGGSA
jgi:anti-sigma B factor antagonist